MASQPTRVISGLRRVFSHFAVLRGRKGTRGGTARGMKNRGGQVGQDRENAQTRPHECSRFQKWNNRRIRRPLFSAGVSARGTGRADRCRIPPTVCLILCPFLLFPRVTALCYRPSRSLRLSRSLPLSPVRSFSLCSTSSLCILSCLPFSILQPSFPFCCRAQFKSPPDR